MYQPEFVEIVKKNMNLLKKIEGSLPVKNAETLLLKFLDKIPILPQLVKLIFLKIKKKIIMKIIILRTKMINILKSFKPLALMVINKTILFNKIIIFKFNKTMIKEMNSILKYLLKDILMMIKLTIYQIKLKML